MGNVIMKAQQITYGASNVEKALDDLKAPELIELNKRMDAIDAWKANVHEETYTGSELTIDNALALPARSLITEIQAIQDLHGYDKPWAGGAGKNKAHIDSTKIFSTNKDPSNPITGIADGMLIVSSSANGYIRGENVVSYTINDSNSITAKMADNDASASYGVGIVVAIDTSKTYTLSLVKTGGDVRIGWLNADGSNLSFAGEQTLPCNLTPPSGAKYLMILCCPGRNAEHTFSNIQLEEGSSATTFNPWSNICPISGRASAVVTRSDGDEISEDFTIQLGQTVYGGSVDFTTGVATVTDVIKDLGTITYSYHPALHLFYGDLPSDAASVVSGGRDGISSIYKVVHTVPNDGELVMLNILYGNNKTIWINDSRYTDPTEFKTAVTGQTVTYPLATPLELTLTPTEVQMLKGYNRVSIEDGTIELKALVLGGDY